MLLKRWLKYQIDILVTSKQIGICPLCIKSEIMIKFRARFFVYSRLSS